jgi:hypothetical protein
MSKFNKQLAALVFLTLVATGIVLPAVATQAQSPAEQLCRLRPCSEETLCVKFMYLG